MAYLGIAKAAMLGLMNLDIYREIRAAKLYLYRSTTRVARCD